MNMRTYLIYVIALSATVLLSFSSTHSSSSSEPFMEVVVAEQDPQSRCPGESIIVEASFPAPVLLSPWYIWQISLDGGNTWIDATAETENAVLTITNLPANAQYRVHAAEEPTELADALLRFTSDPLIIAFNPIDACFTTPINPTGTLCDNQLGENIFPEGDFGSGLSQLGPELPPGTTTYIFQDTTWPNDGFYSLINLWDTDICEGFFPFPCWSIPITDNSDDPEGYALAINATEGETGIFFKNTVSGLCENTTYQFSVDIKNLNHPLFAPFTSTATDTVILPNIDFILGPVDAPLELLQVAPEAYNTGDIINNGQWDTYGFTFTTEPGVTEVSFAIRNNAPGGGGNDLLLDNISFRMCASAEVDFQSPICAGSTTTLEAIPDGQFSSPAIRWQVSADGITWSNVAGVNGTSIDVSLSSSAVQYRYLLAGSIANLEDPSCRVASEVAQLEVFDSAPIVINESICDGEIFEFGSERLSRSGTYSETFQAIGGCDSIVTLELTVTPLARFAIQETICEGDLYKGIFYPGDTIIEERYLNSIGCDSIVSTNLIVLTRESREQNISICPGESFLGVPVFSDTAFIVSGTSDEGCELQIYYDVNLLMEDDLEFTGDLILCEDGTSTLGLAGDYQSFEWSTGAQTSEIEIPGVGTYGVTVTTPEFCIVSGEVEVVSAEDVEPQVAFINPNCSDSNTGRIAVTPIIGGNGPYLYALGNQPFTDNPFFDNLPPGDYEVNIIDASGCSYEVLGTLTESDRQFELVNESQLQVFPGDTVALTVASASTVVSYDWSPGRWLSCTDCPTPIASPRETITYTLTAINSDSCMASTDFLVIVNDNLIAVPNAFSPNEDGVNDVLRPAIVGPVRNITRYAIYNRWGERIFMVANAAPESPSLEWDGTFQGQLLDNAVFTWFAEVELESGKSAIVSGDVLLVK